MRAPRRRVVAAVLMTGVMTTGLATATAQASPAHPPSQTSPTASKKGSEPKLTAHPPKKCRDDNSPCSRYSRVLSLESSKRKHPIKRHTISAALGDLNRKTRNPKKCAMPGQYPGGGFTGYYPDKGFCWNKGDSHTSKWVPQGLTHSSEKKGKPVTVASWHGKIKGKDNKQARVTFVGKKHKKYRHVVLADPGTNKSPGFKAVPTHAGGIAWVGHYLYVADSGRGVRVFDLNHVWKANGGKNDGKYNINKGTVHAAGYGYVLPQVGSYTAPKAAKPKHACNTKKNPYFSSISLDRKPGGDHALVSGEYCGNHGNGKGRLVRWPVQTHGKNAGLLKSKGHTVTPTSWYSVPHKQMQGVTTYGKKAYATSSEGKKPGVWHAMKLAGSGKGSAVHTRNNYKAAAPGPEDVMYSRFGKRYWTLTEKPDKRFVFPNDAKQTSCFWFGC